ncbi:hypothetical protein [Raoultibacter phocaeensis]|uniref:hypothetical protein n=1 Tax=Raoultibacter phocaeensis TaxID=2479841 RepID=UPI00111A5CEA|nr:hypothetical protein [Raoultibacter phocaeensis]
MGKQTAKKAGAVVGVVALASAGIAGAMPALASENPAAIPAVQTTEAAVSGDAAAKGVANVQGTFGFDQATVSSNAGITQVFAKASAMLCNGLPNYGMMTMAQSIMVSGDVDTAFAATVSEMAEKTEAKSLLMACACASNIPGGGAIVNAEVSGVTLESLAAMAGAQ